MLRHHRPIFKSLLKQNNFFKYNNLHKLYTTQNLPSSLSLEPASESSPNENSSELVLTIVKSFDEATGLPKIQWLNAQSNKLVQEYIGEVKNGVKHGWGIEKYSNGVVYEGEFKNDKPSGYCKLVVEDKIYEFVKNSKLVDETFTILLEGKKKISNNHILQTPFFFK